MTHRSFAAFSFIISTLVVCGIGAEFIGILLGLINANELLIVCTIGGLANLVAFRLSKKALSGEH
jgi:hypothetical protein